MSPPPLFFLSSLSISFAFPLFTSVSLFLSVRVCLIYHLCYVPPSIFPFIFSSEFLSRCLRFGSLLPPCIYIPPSYHLGIPLSTSFLHLLSLSSSPSLVQYRSHSSRPLLPCVASAPLLPRFRAFLNLSLIYTSSSFTHNLIYTSSSFTHYTLALDPRA